MIVLALHFLAGRDTRYSSQTLAVPSYAAAATKGLLIRCTVLALTLNLSATLRMLSPAFRAARMRVSSSAAMPRSAKLFALILGPPKPGADTFLNHCPLKLGEYAHHLEQRLAGRRRGVEALLVQKEVDMKRVQLG